MNSPKLSSSVLPTTYAPLLADLKSRVRVAQVNVLCAVANSGPVTPTDLAAALVMDKSTLSRDVEKLVARGWVETAAGDDAREPAHGAPVRAV